MRFAVEAWAPEYGASVDGIDLDQAAQQVDASVEAPLGDWEPIDPVGAVPTERVTFVDGVRRVDARVWITVDGIARPGVCATVAAGAVRCDGAAEVVESRVLRGLYAHPTDAEDIVTRHGTYVLVPLVEEGSEAAYLAVHDQMTHLEREVSDSLTDGGMVVLDGPLRGRRGAGGVGYVKSQHVQYLPEDEQRVVSRLDDGQRSPLFLIGGGFARYSWYLRLPGPRTHPFAGVVRCEVPGEGPIADAIHTADQVTAALPRFASAAYKDSRAPQNLYPIAGLERDLRHKLGDPALMERALRLASAL